MIIIIWEMVLLIIPPVPEWGRSAVWADTQDIFITVQYYCAILYYDVVQYTAIFRIFGENETFISAAFVGALEVMITFPKSWST